MDRIVHPHTLESTRAWLRAQARATEMLATGFRNLAGQVAPPYNGALVVPAGVADALARWVRRAHIEVKYLPRDSDQRTTLIQAAYVTETFVRAARDGELFLPNPALTYKRIGQLMTMIELNQGIRYIEARRRELDLVRPWFAAWRSSIGVTMIVTSASTRPAADKSDLPGESSKRLWIKVMCGAALATGLGWVPLPLFEQSPYCFGTSSMRLDLPQASSAPDPAPHPVVHADISGAGARSRVAGISAQDGLPATAVRLRVSASRRALDRSPARSEARHAKKKPRRSPSRS